MNVFILLAIVFALFILVDVLTAILMKRKRNALQNCSLVLLCVAAIASGVAGGKHMARERENEARILYQAYSYLLEGNIEKAAENAEKVNNTHSEIIFLIVDCFQENYAGAFINADDLKGSGKLGKELKAQVDRIYTLAQQMTGLEGVLLEEAQVRETLLEIAGQCFSQMKVSKEQEVEFLSGFQRDRMLSSDEFSVADEELLREMLSETPNNQELLTYSVKYYNAIGDLDAAEKNAKKLLDQEKSVENIVLFTDVVSQKLLDDTDINTYDKNDKEIAALVRKAEEAEELADMYDPDNPRQEEYSAKAEDYKKQVNQVKAKRIINWLIAQSPLFGDQSGMIDLQLSKLYAAAGNEEKARKLVMDLVKEVDEISDDSPIKSDVEELAQVYYNASASDDEIAAAIGTVVRNDIFLPDSILGRSYSQFLNNFMKYERVSVFISRVDAEDFPTVRAYLNVNGQKDGVEELANDFEVGDFTFVDNGYPISSKDVKQIEDDGKNLISIALVIDGSGSMSGSRIQNARKAVESCIGNIVPETQELSIVLYSNDGMILTPLTNDVPRLLEGASRIRDGGGTNISSGLYAGLESLKTAKGAKAIILMTDGEDGSPELMEDAIAAAQKANVAVFTVSTGGGDRSYMENIATQTGGTYMEAVTDEELINVYTALQNFIVNNYCFEFTVKEDLTSNPRVLTIGLADYGINSSRIYSYDGMVLTEDGSYMTKEDTDPLRLLYAEPAAISAKDLEFGISVFVSARGVKDGAKVLINGEEVKNVRVVDNSGLTFLLHGRYNPGALNVVVRLPDGTSRSSDSLLSIEGNGRLAAQTISLGGGNYLYADYVEQRDDYTLKLSGSVVLNGFIRTNSDVIVQARGAITSQAGRLTLNGGTISGTGAAYVDFAAWGKEENYGKTAFGGGSLQVLDSFHFSFDQSSVDPSNPNTSLKLPGFGTVRASAQLNGTELTYTLQYGTILKELQDNLNYALNGIPFPQNSDDRAMEVITGYSVQNGEARNNGIYVNADEVTFTVKKDFARIAGTGRVSGYLGSIVLEDAKIEIDTDQAEGMFAVKGTADLGNLSAMGIGSQTPFTIDSKGYYPEKFSLTAGSLSVEMEEISSCFTEGAPPKAIDASFTADYPFSLENEPYKGQIESLIGDIAKGGSISLEGDEVEFLCSDDSSKKGVKVYNSSGTERYVAYQGEDIVVPIADMDELFLFGNSLGGEISGTVTINEERILLELEANGHLDNSYFGIRHDGMAKLSVVLYRNATAGSIFPVTLDYGEGQISYNVSATGGILAEDGFSTYVEGDGR